MNVIPNEAQLRVQLVQAAQWVREQLKRADIGSNFTLRVEITGPIQIGEAKLTYNLDCSANYGNSVDANSLNEATFELLRRMGWQKTNRGLQLTWDGADAPSLEQNE